MFRTTIIAVGASVLLGAAAQAAVCGQEAAGLAAEFRMSQDVPVETSKGTATVPPAPPVTVESRGLLGTDKVEPPIEQPKIAAPPATGMGELPPPPAGDAMRPLPPRGAPDRPTMRPGPGGFSLEDHQKAEALLSSAKQADAAGRPQECQQRLQEAKKLLPGPVTR